MSLSNSQINAILKEYDSRQFHARAELDRRKAKIYRELPEYKLLDDELISSSADFARKVLLEGGHEDISELAKHNDKLISKKKDILTSAGYPDDYLSIHYECSKCQDTGYIGNEKCPCFKQAAIKLLYSQALIKTAVDTQNFSTFDYTLYSDTCVDPVYGVTPRENIHKIVTLCSRFISDLKTEPDKRSIKNLLIMGSTGVGKTFLSNCIAKAALDEANSVVYITAGDLFDILEDASFSRDFDGDGNNAGLENIEQCDLLIIDDLGTEFTNRFTNAKLYSCINKRLLENLPMVISTNLNFKDLQQTYSERICSRFIGEFTTLKIIGDDIRLKKS